MAPPKSKSTTGEDKASTKATKVNEEEQEKAGLSAEKTDTQVDHGVTFRVVKTERVKLDDLSTAEDSSWREIDLDEVAKFEKVIYGGEHGKTNLSMSAQVLCDDAGYVMAKMLDPPRASRPFCIN